MNWMSAGDSDSETSTFVGPFLIPTQNAHVAVHYHVALKGTQVGTVVGLVGSPLFLAARRVSFRDPLYLHRFGSIMLLGAALGTVSSFALGVAKLRNEPEERIVDRAYRIKHNRGQQLVDKFSLAGLAGGFALGLVKGRTPLVGLHGACVGCAVSVILYPLSSLFRPSDQQ